MPANLEIAAVATGLDKVCFHSNPKERQCQRMLKGKWKSLSRVRLLATPWIVQSREFSSILQNTGVGSCSLLQEIVPTQRSNPGLAHCRRILYQLSHKVQRCWEKARWEGHHGQKPWLAFLVPEKGTNVQDGSEIFTTTLWGRRGCSYYTHFPIEDI